jgi:tRNA(adenine34) deaminase
MLDRAIELALANEARGGLPVGAVIGLDGRIIAEGVSEVLGPTYHPGRHAEIQALAQVAIELWPRAAEMTVVTTLEPWLMCFGACLLHGIGRIVFGALDVRGGSVHPTAPASVLREHRRANVDRTRRSGALRSALSAHRSSWS